MSMTVEEKEKIALTRDMSKAATALRLRAARSVAKIDQQMKAADLCGVSLKSYNNMEMGVSYPHRDVMKYYYRSHKIDFNFILHGDFDQLPLSIQDQLFDALSEIEVSRLGQR